MIEGLHRFVRELRAAGLSASPAEWLDALHAVDRCGIEDREQLRLAMRCTLAKRADQQPTFDRLFESFFATPARASRKRGGAKTAASGAGGPGRSGTGSGAPTIRPRPETAARGKRPRHLMAPRDPRQPERLLRTLKQIQGGDPERRCRWRRFVSDNREARTGQRAGTGPPRSEERALAQAMALEEERAVAAVVPRLIEQIRLRKGRRLRRAPRGRLDLRRLFRENLAQGGVPFRLPQRRFRPRRSKVVLLVDASWSAARAAGLFLAIAGEFVLRWRDTRVLFFVDRAVEGSAEVRRWLRGSPAGPRSGSGGGARGVGKTRSPGAGIARDGVSFARVLTGLPGLNLEAPSDYGRAFHTLLRGACRPGGRKTVLLILGDGRTNRFDAQDWAFEELAERCGAVLWLVPEAMERWGTGDSALGAYLPHVDTVVEARDLLGLGRGVAELLRRL